MIIQILTILILEIKYIKLPSVSCQYVMKQFKEKYPKIDVTIIYKQLEF